MLGVISEGKHWAGNVDAAVDVVGEVDNGGGAKGLLGARNVSI